MHVLLGFSGLEHECFAIFQTVVGHLGSLLAGLNRVLQRRHAKALVQFGNGLLHQLR